MHLDTDFWDLCIGEFVGAWFLCPIFFYFVWQVLYLVKTEMLDRKVRINVFIFLFFYFVGQVLYLVKTEMLDRRHEFSKLN